MTHPQLSRRPGHRGTGAAAALLAMLLVLCGAGAAPAWAHTELTSSDPADGGTVGQPPATVRLVFADRVAAVDPGAPVLTLTVAGSDPVDVPAIVDGETVTADLTTAGLPGIGSADYPASWEIGYRLVAPDGDTFRGSIAFTVTAPPQPAVSSPATPVEPMTPATPASGSGPVVDTPTASAGAGSTDPPTAASPPASPTSTTTASTSEVSAAAPGTTGTGTAPGSAAVASGRASDGGSGWWWAAAVAVVVLIAGGLTWFRRSHRQRATGR